MSAPNQSLRDEFTDRHNGLKAKFFTKAGDASDFTDRMWQNDVPCRVKVLRSKDGVSLVVTLLSPPNDP